MISTTASHGRWCARPTTRTWLPGTATSGSSPTGCPPTGGSPRNTRWNTLFIMRRREAVVTTKIIIRTVFVFSWELINKVCTLSVCPYPEKRNSPGFVNISRTLVIDTSIERSSRVLQYWNPKSWIFFKNIRNWRYWILSVPREKKSPWLCQYQSYISNWCINGKVFTSTTAWKHNNLNFFKQVRNWILTCAKELKSFK